MNSSGSGDDLEPLPTKVEDPADEPRQRASTQPLLVVVAAIALAAGGFAGGLALGDDSAELAELRAGIASVKQSVDQGTPQRVWRQDIRGPLLIVNPCPQELDAELRDDGGRTRWGGQLTPGVNVIEQLTAINVNPNWSIEHTVPGGTTSFPLGDWLDLGAAIVPALSCPSG